MPPRHRHRPTRTIPRAQMRRFYNDRGQRFRFHFMISNSTLRFRRRNFVRPLLRRRRPPFPPLRRAPLGRCGGRRNSRIFPPRHNFHSFRLSSAAVAKSRISRLWRRFSSF